MLQLLRHIRKELLGPGNARKYLLYAVGEVLLVMVGILLALQVNNWNEWRKDRKEERILLVDLAENLERNMSMFEEAMNEIENRNKSSAIILEVIKNNAPYKDTLDTHFGRSLLRGQLAPPIPLNGYESLKNAGFNKITSSYLKNQIIALFEELYRNAEEWRHYTNDFAIQDKTQWYKYFVRYQGGFKPLNMDIIRTNTEYLSLLEDVLVFRRIMSENYKNALVETQRVHLLIREELGEVNGSD